MGKFRCPYCNEFYESDKERRSCLKPSCIRKAFEGKPLSQVKPTAQKIETKPKQKPPIPEKRERLPKKLVKIQRGQVQIRRTDVTQPMPSAFVKPQTGSVGKEPPVVRKEADKQPPKEQQVQEASVTPSESSGIKAKKVEARHVINKFDFSKVVFFSGSVSYYDMLEKVKVNGKKLLQTNDKKYLLSANYKNFVLRINEKLTKALEANDWKYVLNQKEAQVYFDGEKEFKLYIPKKKVSKNATDLDGVNPALQEGVVPENLGRFLCTASIGDVTNKVFEGSLKPKAKIGERSVDNCSSRVARTQLSDFVAKGLINNKAIGFPVFSVCDCNSFHTSGYLWGLYAINKALAKLDEGPIAVLNFDQHQDSGTFTTDIVASDGWGRPLLLDGNLQKKGGCYLSIGNASYNTITSKLNYTVTCDFVPNKIDQSKPEIKSPNDAWNTFWEKAVTYFGSAIKYVFISVDRDCLKDHYTQWGDHCFFTIETLKECIKKVLTPLIEMGACVIGFDITGLPEHSSMKPREPRKKADIVWSLADTQISELLTFITPYLSETAKK